MYGVEFSNLYWRVRHPLSLSSYCSCSLIGQKQNPNSYVEDNVSWTVGFGACWAMMVLYLTVFLLGAPTYRAERPAGDVRFAETLRAWAARVFRRKDAAGTER